MGIELDSPAQFVKGVGPARALLLEKLGIKTVRDLLEHFPFRYEHQESPRAIGELELDQAATVIGEIRSVRGSGGYHRPSLSAVVEDGTGRCRVRWFNSQYLRDQVQVGRTIRLHGKVTAQGDLAQFVNPRFEFVDDPADLKVADGDRLIPVYPATEQLGTGRLRGIVDRALSAAGHLIEETLWPALRERRGLGLRRTAIEKLHRPRRTEDTDAGRRRLAYEELLLMQLAVMLKRKHLETGQKAPVIRMSEAVDERIRRRFPFALTPSQDKVVAEIAADLSRSRPMNRLLQGDVGSGKTAVALYAALTAIAGRHQVAFMAPTEILAEQHFQSIERYLAGSRVRRALLVGGQNAAIRRETLSRIEAGQIDLVVGTHAILQEPVTFRSLGVVIVDEQHKFGVRQRATIRSKALSPHSLVMTATPIPRTLAMTVFGDLDVSVIEGLPPGRMPVATTCYRPQAQGRAWSLVRQRLSAGEQVFVVYPLIEASESAEGEPVRAATKELHRLRQDVLHGWEVGLLHGQMPTGEKEAAMEAFRRGEIQVLVATTVVEVGIDVPNATVMVVENAERFGLSQLHQLRGRVGRGGKCGYCLLLAHRMNKVARRRLETLCQTTDGFAVAEEDLRLRGPGELLGTRQHGLPSLRVADLSQDLKLLRAARTDAVEIVRNDPQLTAPGHAELRRALIRSFSGALALIDVA